MDRLYEPWAGAPDGDGERVKVHPARMTWPAARAHRVSDQPDATSTQRRHDMSTMTTRKPSRSRKLPAQRAAPDGQGRLNTAQRTAAAQGRSNAAQRTAAGRGRSNAGRRAAAGRGRSNAGQRAAAGQGRKFHLDVAIKRLTPAERADKGRKLRTVAPRSSHADFDAAGRPEIGRASC